MKIHQKVFTVFCISTLFSALVGCNDKLALSDNDTFSIDESSTSLELSGSDGVYREICPLGTCKVLGAPQTVVVTTPIHVRVQSGESKVVYGKPISILVSKGAAVETLTAGLEKSVYFEGSAREYSVGKDGSTFLVKDTCGAISKIGIGSDLKVKLVFADGIQELVMVKGTSSFRFVYQGVQKLYISLAENEFFPLGYNYLDSSENSKKIFNEICETEETISCAQLCEKVAKENKSPILFQRPISATEYRCDIKSAKIYFSVPKECTATFKPACELGVCKSVESHSNYFVPSTDLTARILSGQARNIFGSNRSDVNVVVHKGAAASYGDQPATNKRMYFEGLAKDYKFNVTGNIVKIKDSCGVISQMTVGEDLKVKMIFQDGTQEIALVPGQNGSFRFVINGIQKTLVFLSAGEFLDAGWNYMNTSETSKPFFAEACDK